MKYLTTLSLFTLLILIGCSDENLTGVSAPDSSTESVDVEDLPPGPGKTAVPFKASFEFDWNLVDVAPPILTFEFPGTGIASHLGKSSISGTVLIDISTIPNTSTSTVVITAANGDELHLTSVGEALPPDAEGIAHGTGEFTITGGTGRFSSATGSGTFSAVVHTIPPPSKGRISFLGTVSY